MRVAPEQKAAKNVDVTSCKKRTSRTGRRWRLWVIAIRYLRACIFLVNVRTLTMVAIACIMVYLCESSVLDLRFRMEFSIVSVGTVFPLVFSIQQAFSRREEALRNLAVLRGQLMGIYFCNRDWDVSDGVSVRSSLGLDSSPRARRTAQLLTQLLKTLKHWLAGRTAFESEAEWRMLYGTTELRKEITHQLSGDFFRGEEDRKDSRKFDSDEEGDDDEEEAESQAVEAAAEQDPHWELYFQLYDILSQINVHNEQLTQAAGCSKGGEAGMSRLAAYTSKTVEVIERLRSLREYRTPFMLRYVSFILVVASVFLAAPYFAWMCNSTRWDEDTTGSCPAGYFTAVLYVLVLSTLFHVQVALENPFDGIGMDDVFFNMDREFAVTVRRYDRSRARAARELQEREREEQERNEEQQEGGEEERGQVGKVETAAVAAPGGRRKSQMAQQQQQRWCGASSSSSSYSSRSSKRRGSKVAPCTATSSAAVNASGSSAAAAAAAAATANACLEKDSGSSTNSDDAPSGNNSAGCSVSRLPGEDHKGGGKSFSIFVDAGGGEIRCGSSGGEEPATASGGSGSRKRFLQAASGAIAADVSEFSSSPSAAAASGAAASGAAAVHDGNGNDGGSIHLIGSASGSLILLPGELPPQPLLQQQQQPQQPFPAPFHLYLLPPRSNKLSGISSSNSSPMGLSGSNSNTGGAGRVRPGSSSSSSGNLHMTTHGSLAASAAAGADTATAASAAFHQPPGTRLGALANMSAFSASGGVRKAQTLPVWQGPGSGGRIQGDTGELVITEGKSMLAAKITQLGSWWPVGRGLGYSS